MSICYSTWKIFLPTNSRFNERVVLNCLSPMSPFQLTAPSLPFSVRTLFTSSKKDKNFSTWIGRNYGEIIWLCDKLASTSEEGSA